ncbi:E3 ubiquitin-protein ligase mycbp2 [Branchiostoma belcheri]|nr:E3 ubiquitin-protein ligase mycbp2 [Branchiostoma belcheri]
MAVRQAPELPVIEIVKCDSLCGRLRDQCHFRDYLSAADSLFQLLIDLVNNSGPETSPTSDCTSLAALACSCLLSLVVARGDTGKLLNAVAALLISPGSQSAQAVKTLV